MSRYIKTFSAILGVISTWGITAGADGGYSQVELYGLLGALATALAVYAFPNQPPAGEPADPGISEQGQVDLMTGVVMFLAALLALVVYAALT